ncbi:hypothetical protein JOB18_024431 [Solea senegalensis]|uniref:Uncharacterized protein n=1 Tax=Solea senegalensis TaxID=28829 RepID=A0AAV6R213_SOLSE|nr:hypothetical protein JOB18_024431 [Solea senegalensis]
MGPGASSSPAMLTHTAKQGGGLVKAHSQDVHSQLRAKVKKPKADDHEQAKTQKLFKYLYSVLLYKDVSDEEAFHK